MTGVCDLIETAGTWTDYKLDGDCAASVTYTGKSGCVAFDGYTFIASIKPFSGAILILVGGLMTFAGAKFLFQLVSAFVTMITSIVFYTLCSNILFDAQTTVSL
jgi:hypothetical protein